MAYQSVHTGPEVDAAVSALSDVQDIRTEVAADKVTVTTLAGQTATNAGLAQTAATNAQADAASALTSRNEAHTSAQAAAASAAASDAARAQSVVAKNGAEQARDSAWEAEDETRALLSESGPTIDAINAELRRMKYGSGPYPSLELGFVGASMLDRRVEFTRASNATYWDELGTLQTAGPNEPRFDYDPVTGESLGLLVEGQATNLLRNTNDPSVWTSGAGGVSALLNGAVLENIEVIGGVARARIRLPQGQTGRLAFLPGGTLTGIHAARARIRVLEGWKENSLNFTITGASVFSHIFTPPPLGQWGFIQRTEDINGTGEVNFIRRANTTDPDIVVEVEAQQLEAGPIPTSYIPTEASQVTRASSRPSIIGDSFDSVFNRNEWTLFFKIEDCDLTATNNRYVMGLSDGTTTNYAGILARGGVFRFAYPPSTSGSALPVAGTNIFAMAYKAGNIRVYVNGVSIYNAAMSQEMSDSFNQLALGSIMHSNDFYNVRSVNFREVAIFPRSLPDAQLVELTTP